MYNGKDVFATGFGKSIYMMPLVFDYTSRDITSGSHSVIIVISPLLSLMADQVAALRRVYVFTVCLLRSDVCPLVVNTSF